MTEPRVLPKARIFMPTVSAGPLALTGEQAHYVHHVLRLAAGKTLAILASDGRVALAEIREVRPETVLLEVGAPQPAPSVGTTLTLCVAPPKGERADWIVEKVTELGVAQLVWMETARSVVLPKAAGSREKRWSRLAEAAARQCGRASVPVITGPQPFAQCLTLAAQARLLAHAAGPRSLVEVAAGLASASAQPHASMVLLIGPEGGFAPDELLLAEQAGYTAVRLAPYTLRVETAAVAGAAVLLGPAELIFAEGPVGNEGEGP